MPAQVEVDAFPGEKFVGRVARIAPVFDPQTRTAEMEDRSPEPGFRLKPGMYARVDLTIDSRTERADGAEQAAIVDLEGKTGVFVAATVPAGGASSATAPTSGPGSGGRE